MKTLLSILFLASAIVCYAQPADNGPTKVTTSASASTGGFDVFPFVGTAPANYTVGEMWKMKFANTNTQPVKVNRSTKGNKEVRKYGNTPLASGDIVAGVYYLVIYDGTYFQCNDCGTNKEYGVACSDLVTEITAGTSKAYFRIPRGFTVTSVRAALLTAQTSGTILTIDINEGGTTILSTKLTIDNTEKTSTTAATPYVLSDTSLADDAIITIDVDAAGTGGYGLIVWIVGY